MVHQLIFQILTMEPPNIQQPQPEYHYRYILISLLTLLVNLTFLPLQAQGPVKLRSTISAGGSAEKISSAKNKFPIQQSVGQSGVIGTYEAKGYILRQGFIQPIYKNVTTKNERLNIKIAPNPFSDVIMIRTDPALTGKIHITLYDLLGKPVYRNQHYASQELSVDLGSLPNGLYFLKMTSANKTFTTKLLKK